LRMRRALRLYAADTQQDEGARSWFEQEVSVALPSREEVRGRIDRYDLDAQNGCKVIDFKYAGFSALNRLKEREKSGVLLQLGIYLLALQKRGFEPRSAAYAPLRTAVDWYVRNDTDELMQAAYERAKDAVTRLLAGEIAPNPAVSDDCQYCESAAACRIAEVRRGVAAEAAS